MRKALDEKQPGANPEYAKHWNTTVNRIAAARCTLRDGTMLCVASLHCSKSEGTADLLASLKIVLEETAAADLYVIGVDSNVAYDDVAEFKVRLRKIGFSFAEGPEAQQVTA